MAPFMIAENRGKVNREERRDGRGGRRSEK